MVLHTSSFEMFAVILPRCRGYEVARWLEDIERYQALTTEAVAENMASGSLTLEERVRK